MRILSWLSKKVLSLIKDPHELYDILLFLRELENMALEDSMASFDWQIVRDRVADDIERNGGDISKVRIIMYDGRYRAPRLTTWKEITRLMPLTLYPYIKEYFDCDDYSMAFKCNVSQLLLINGVGVASGIVRHRDGSSYGHAWNVLLVNENNSPSIYTYDPQVGEIVKGVYNVSYRGATYTPDLIIL